MTWEYMIFSVTDENLRERAETMNKLGAEGWELVTLESFDTQKPDLYFKRRLSKPSENYNDLSNKFTSDR